MQCVITAHEAFRSDKCKFKNLTGLPLPYFIMYLVWLPPQEAAYPAEKNTVVTEGVSWVQCMGGII